jgi:hypothetical protein
VYRDPALKWPYNQTNIPGSGPPSEDSVLTGIPSDATGRFDAIYLDPALEYSYNLYSATGTLLETGINVNVSNPPETLVAYKLSTTARSNTTVLTNDPDLQLEIMTPGFYRVEIDVTFFASAAASANMEVAYSTSVSALTGNTLAVFGISNDLNTVFVAPVNTATGVFNVNTLPNQNCLHLVGVMDFTSAGTLSLKWAQGAASDNAVCLGIGSAIYATLLT